MPAVKRPLPPGCFKDETPATPDAAIWSCRPTQLALLTNAVLGGVVRSSGYVVPNALSDESVALQSDFSVVYIKFGHMQLIPRVLCLGVVSATTLASSHVVSLTPDISRLVAPVLKVAANSASSKGAEKDAEVLDARLERVLEDHSAASTEALVVLLGFYIGEHPAEDISCEIVARGAQVLPLLHRYAEASVIVPGINMATVRPIKTEYEVVESRIQSGEKCVREE